MIKVGILDCTLRDGGYYTNWDFDRETIGNYLKYTNDLPIEYIEIGYKSIVKNDYFGEYFYLPLSTLRYIKKQTSKKISIMLNAKDCIGIDLERLFKNTKEHISLVRIATDPSKIESSIELAVKLKKIGFDVALNIMYISQIDKNHKFFDYLDKVEEIIKYLYLVDSYGSIYPDEFERLVGQIQSKTNVALGFHGHNNLELAFANTLKAIESSVQIIDATVLGMGRGAGNLRMELILTHLKLNSNFDVDLNILGKLTETFQDLLYEYNWGTNLAYIVSGGYSLPQKSIMRALDINRYSLSGIVNQLKSIKQISLPIFEPKRNFDKCIIIGGSKSVMQHIFAIKEYLLKNRSILLIHSTSKYINFFEDIKNNQYFSVAGDELLKINKNIKSIENYILEPSPGKIGLNIPNREFFFELKNIDFIDDYFNSPLTIS